MFLKVQSDSLFSRIAPIRWEKWLPDYVTPLPPSISKQDCRFLKKEGAFDVPDTRVRDELIKSYIQFVHPLLPILNLEDFLVVIDKSYTGTQGISFLLFQAVMFAATSYETTKSLTREGFRDRREARKTRYERVKLLYSYGCEDDRIAILQTVLLMTYWDESSKDSQDAWYYVGVAKALATSIEKCPSQSDAERGTRPKGFWRRMRWSCYMRDRLIAITKRRPLQIDEREFDIPMLTISDFEMGPLSTKCCLGTDGSHPAIRDPPTRRVLVQAGIALARFCQCISRILESQYAVAQKEQVVCSMAHLIPKHPGAKPGEVLLRDSELEEWRSSLPGELRWPPVPATHTHRHGEVISYFCAMLSGIYNVASSALHRPQTVCTPSHIPELKLLSEQRVRDSAIQTTTVHKYFREKGQIGLLPDGQVAMLESAILAHLSDLQSTSTLQRQSAIQNFHLCAKALKQLSYTYASAEESLALVNAAVQKTNLPHKNPVNSASEPSLYPQENYFDKPIECGSASSSVGNLLSESAVWEQIRTLEPPQMGKLLFSHFMMTPSERTLLAQLVPSDRGDSRTGAGELSSVSEQTPQHRLQSPPNDESSCPIHAILGSLDDQTELDEDHLRGHHVLESSSRSSRSTSRALIQDLSQLDEVEWDVFTMLSQYGTE